MSTIEETSKVIFRLVDDSSNKILPIRDIIDEVFDRDEDAYKKWKNKRKLLAFDFTNDAISIKPFLEKIEDAKFIFSECKKIADKFPPKIEKIKRNDLILTSLIAIASAVASGGILNIAFEFLGDIQPLLATWGGVVIAILLIIQIVYKNLGLEKKRTDYQKGIKEYDMVSSDAMEYIDEIRLIPEEFQKRHKMLCKNYLKVGREYPPDWSFNLPPTHRK